MKTVHFRFKKGDEFFIERDDSFLKCVILEQGGYNISKGIFEYLIFVYETKETFYVKEQDLYFEKPQEDIGYEIDE